LRDVGAPRWVRVIAVGSAIALASFGGAGLLLADLGVYSLLLALALGLAGFALLWVWIRPVVDDDRAAGDARPTDGERNSAIAAVVLCAASAIWNGANASQHAQINRDGGLYLNAGKWIASHGTLNLQPFTGPFAPYLHSTGLVAVSSGMKQHGTHLEFQISHMLPAVLAIAQNLGGNRLMFMTVPIISGAALLAFYVLATRLLRHTLAALGATATLALLMPQISFSRDSTTEIPIQLLLFTALWLLGDRRTLRRPRAAFVAGLLLGLVQAMHVDGLAFLVGLPAVFAITWLHTNRERRTQLRRGIPAACGGVAVGIALSAVDITRWDRSYISVVRGNVERVAAVEILAIAGAIAVVLLVRRASVLRTIQRARAGSANVAGVTVLVGGFGAWLVRPALEHVHAHGGNPTVAFVQQLNHLPIDATKRYGELSVRWISWYAGPITLTIAIVAAAGLAVAFVRGGALRLPVQLTTLMLAPPALLYIWRPTITPDQVWAARRFLPAVFPGLVLLAFAALVALARTRARRLAPYAGPRRSLALVVALATVAFPWVTIRHVSQMTEQRGLLPVIDAACKILGHNSAVVVLQEPRSTVWQSDPQTLRSFCNVPVTVMVNRPDPALLHLLAAQWKAQRRRLFVVASAPRTILTILPHADLRVTGRRTNPHFLEQTLTRIPDKYMPETLQLTLAAVPPIAGTLITPAPVGSG